MMISQDLDLIRHGVGRVIWDCGAIEVAFVDWSSDKNLPVIMVTFCSLVVPQEEVAPHFHLTEMELHVHFSSDSLLNRLLLYLWFIVVII